MNRVVDFEQIVENQPFIIMRLSLEKGEWKTWYVSNNIERYGFGVEESIQGDTGWSDLLHPNDRVLAVKRAADYMELRLDDYRLSYRILTRSGESISITEYSHVNRDADGDVVCVDSVLLNTTLTQGDDQIAVNHFHQQAIMNDILLSLQDADHETSLQIILGRTGAYLDCSRALLFKDSPDHKTCKVVHEWLNRGIASVMSRDYAVTYSTEMPEIYVALQKTGMLLVDAGEIPDNCREEFEKEGLVSSAIFAVYLHGEHYGFVCFDDCVINRTWNEDTASFLKNIANPVSTVLHRKHQDERLRHNETAIRQAAYTDHLTGLPNRLRCDRDLDATIARLAASGGHAHALFIDLDDFKVVNDSYGHDFGNGVLVSFAEFLRGFFQDGSGVYRFGGDEFVIIVYDTDDETIRVYLTALMQRAKRPWASRGREFYCSLSMGIVRFTGAGDTPQSVIKKADIAMYQAKTSGKNNFAEYTEGLDSDQLKRAEMEVQLRAAMEDGCRGFVLHYQPYSDTKSGEVVGAAALLRMRGSDKALLLPGQFLSLAECLGLIVPLGDFVLAKAAEQCRVINSLRGYANFTVTVNMSHRQLQQNDIVRRTERILAATGVKLANIIISINEATALEETERMLRVAGEMSRIGVRVALNDFGSGSSSFINMRALPADIVKVSSKYLEDVEDEFTGAFVKLVTDLCHFSGKLICMNNVETDAQYDFCRKFGIDWVQGFLFHRPEDVDALLRRVSTRTTNVFYR